MLSDLRSERQRIQEAIWVIERLAAGGKRRGRPPKWMAQPVQKRTVSAAARKRMDAPQKRRLAAVREAEMA